MSSSCQCIICFEENIKCNFVICSCNTVVCDNCMKEYIESSNSEINKLATCPMCYEEFIGNSFSKSTTIVFYIESLIRYLKNNPVFINLLNTKVKNNRVVEFLRDSKQKYDIKFPKAIMLTLQIIPSLKKQYEVALKANQEKIKDDILKVKTSKKCYSGICNTGYLYLNHDERETCTMCNLVFCEFCDKEYKPNHQCKKEDLDSIAFLKTIVQCPECYTPIERTEGCNAMKCIICKTTFNYKTDNSETRGGYNKYFKIKKYTYSLSSELKGKYDPRILKSISAFENQMPSNYVIDDLSILEKSTEDISIDELYKFYNEYSNYRLSCKAIKEYTRRLLKLRQFHIDEQLTSTNIEIAINGNFKE